MSENGNPSIHTGRGRDALIQFSGEMPKWQVHTIAPEVTGDPEEIKQLRSELGQAALVLTQAEAEVQRLSDTRDRLQAILDVFTDRKPAEQEQPALPLRAVAIEEAPAPPKDAQDIPQAEQHAKQTPASQPVEERPSSPRLAEYEPDETLSPTQQRYERAILYLLQTPGQSIRQQNASGFMRRELGIDSTNWNNLKTVLSELGILSFVKPKTGSKASIEVSLNIETVINLAGSKSFITKRVLDVLRASQDNSETAAVTAAESLDDTTTEAISASTNGAAHEMSPRVRKMMAAEPIKETGHKGTPRKLREPETFLGHRRAARGTRRG